ncbi:DUF5723 family protein [Namhaeicola litoreus]|uniref:DUF5723 family protein n=1 Tax=Namhaeicola litoreus TaxID=1052145 RepID=A0ABW3Y674_9FLAO
MQKSFLFISCLIFSYFVSAQNNQILYGFDGLPQTLNLNPGAEVQMEKHFGIPLLSNIYFQVGVSNSDFNYNAINQGLEGIDGNLSKLRNIFNLGLSKDDFFTGNAQMELLNLGFRLRDPDYYLSFGITTDSKFYGKYPKTTMEMFFYGDDVNQDGLPDVGVGRDLSELLVIGELVNVFYVGINKKVSENFTVGAKIKFLSGAMDVDFRNVEGNYSLGEDAFGDYEHRLNGINAVFNSYGTVDENYAFVGDDPSKIVQDLFFLGGNYGVGIDLGLSGKFSEHMLFSASLLDLDYLKYSSDAQNFEVTEDFEISDEAFTPPFEGEPSYWLNLYDKYYESGQLPLQKLNKSYQVYRSPKLYTEIKRRNILTNYRRNGNSVFRNVRSIYNFDQYELYEEFGIQTFTEFHPASVQWGVTGFYARSLNEYISAKATYTLDSFSYTNFGLGISTHFNTFNFFVTADNLIGLFNYKESNYQSVQVGLNMIIN